MEEFREGQKVTVIKHYGNALDCITSVACVGKRKMTLANGDEFTADGGRRWGHGGHTWYTGPYVRPWRPGDDELLERSNALMIIGRFGAWSSLPTEDLRVVCAIVRKSPKAGA